MEDRYPGFREAVVVLSGPVARKPSNLDYFDLVVLPDDLPLVFADSKSLQIDGEGRIVLPEDLKGHARIDDEVAFVGLGKMFQMWEPGRFARHRAEALERSRRGGATLPPAGRPN